MTQSNRSSRRRLSRSWAILAIVYAVFFFWYTSFEGPLSDEEIAYYTEVLAQAPGDAGLLVRYRSRRDIMEMMEEMVAAGANIHTFKVAAVEKTIAFPIDPWFYPGDPRFLLALVFIGSGLAMQLRYNARTASPALGG